MLAEETKVEFDPFASASNPVVPTYDLFGLVEVNAWACVLDHGKVPWDSNSGKKPLTAIDVFIQPLPEITVKYPKTCEDHWVAEFATWASVTWPSIKAAGVENLRELNGKWARVTRVPGKDKPYPKKDPTGNPTGEMVTPKTMKFVAIYDTEEECRAAAIAAGAVSINSNDQGRNVPTMVVEDPAKATAAQFLKAIVPNAVRGKTTLAEAQAAAKIIIDQYAPVKAHFNENSPETLAIIAEVCPKLQA